jgi:hypothetical protein
MKPEYDQWAEQLLQEIYYAPEEHRVAVIKEHLLKAVQRGYVDGTETGWAAIQDSMPQSPLE